MGSWRNRSHSAATRVAADWQQRLRQTTESSTVELRADVLLVCLASGFVLRRERASPGLSSATRTSAHATKTDAGSAKGSRYYATECVSDAQQGRAVGHAHQGRRGPIHLVPRPCRMASQSETLRRGAQRTGLGKLEWAVGGSGGDGRVWHVIILGAT
jgi:hypothetical protein